jgi:hypothetical protein
MAHALQAVVLVLAFLVGRWSGRRDYRRLKLRMAENLATYRAIIKQSTHGNLR